MRIPVKNESNMPIYVGASMILAGETRDFEEADVPLHLRPAAAAPVAEVKQDPLEELLAKPVKLVLPELANLSDDDLAKFEQMEAAKGDSARKTVTEAIAVEKLARAERLKNS